MAAKGPSVPAQLLLSSRHAMLCLTHWVRTTPAQTPQLRLQTPAITTVQSVDQTPATLHASYAVRGVGTPWVTQGLSSNHA